MATKQKLNRSHRIFFRHFLVVVLGPVAINALRRFNQKPDKIQHNRSYKVENNLIYNDAGNETGIVKYYITNSILHANYKRQNGVLYRTDNTHNRYSTIRRKKYECLNESFITTKMVNLQMWSPNLSNAFLLKSAC